MRIGLGCVQLGSASATVPWREQVALVRRAVDVGVNLFDTADAYGSGSSERILGKAVAGRRGDVTIATKGGYVFRPRSSLEQRARRGIVTVQRRTARARRTSVAAGGGSAPGLRQAGYDAQDFTPRRINEALDGSLRRLGTDYIDLYQFHGPREVHHDALETLIEARRQGKIRAIGVGCETIESAQQWCEVSEVDTLQVPFGVLDSQSVTDLLKTCTRGAVAVPELWARAVLGGGVLAAAVRAPQSVADHPKHDLIDELVAIADDAGIGLDELAVRWVSGHDEVSTMLVGSTRMDHIEHNLELARLPALPDDVGRRLADSLERAKSRGDGS